MVKIWSRSGMLRSTLVKTNFPVYCVVWSSNNDQCLYTNGKNLVIKSLQPGNKPFQWKAHDAPILKVDWSVISGLIISCGEDKKYKVRMMKPILIQPNRFGTLLEEKYFRAPHLTIQSLLYLGVQLVTCFLLDHII